MVVFYHHDPRKNRWVVVAKRLGVLQPMRFYADTREEAVFIRDALLSVEEDELPLVSSVEDDTFFVWATGVDSPLLTLDMIIAAEIGLDPNLVARGIQDYLLDILTQPVYDDAS